MTTAMRPREVSRRLLTKTFLPSGEAIADVHFLTFSNSRSYKIKEAETEPCGRKCLEKCNQPVAGSVWKYAISQMSV